MKRIIMNHNIINNNYKLLEKRIYNIVFESYNVIYVIDENKNRVGIDKYLENSFYIVIGENKNENKTK